MKRYLIINADDFGLCDSANEAVFDLFRTGCIKSSTIMMPCPKAKEAVQFSVDNPEYAIGVHLTLTNEWEAKWPWGSLTKGKSIENEHGRMWPENEDFEAHCTYKESIAEVNAQIDLAEKLGMKIVQIDNHMGSLYGMNGRYLMLPKVFKVCKKRHYPFRMCTTPKKEFCPDGVSYGLYSFFCRFSGILSRIYKVPTPDYLILTDQVKCLKKCETYEEFRDNFLKFHGEIPEGITETFIHPALDTDEMKGITGTWRRRYWEYLVMKDPITHKFFADNDIELISYRELVEMKTKKK
ncbi:MAG: polysaccharide deacetylase family protein [Clostridia bacterium]|nr:polysaccharide deacetylase family protein [Clostridia bacterium]